MTLECKILYDLSRNAELERDTDGTIILGIENCFNSIIKKIFGKDWFDGYAFGISKLVVFIKDSNYVIKIPFTGKFPEFDHETVVEDFLTKEETFTPFAHGSKYNSWDYCRRELDIYNKAVVYGLEDAFAAINLIGYIQGVLPVYLQERCVTFIDKWESDASMECNDEGYVQNEDLTKEQKKTMKCGGRIYNLYWQSLLHNKLGTKKYRKLIKFLKKVDIYDLHNENVGYKEDNLEPVFIDYSDWND